MTTKSKFQAIVKKAEKRGWGFFGLKKKGYFRWWIDNDDFDTPAIELSVEADHWRLHLATVLCNLDFRRCCFGVKTKEKYLNEYRLEKYSQQMFSQGSPPQWLNWLYQYLKRGGGEKHG